MKTKSAEKALRQSKRKKTYNLKRSRDMKAKIKELRILIMKKNKNDANKILPSVYTAIDKAAKKGIIKKNAASRYKGRLTKQVNKL